MWSWVRRDCVGSAGESEELGGRVVWRYVETCDLGSGLLGSWQDWGGGGER